MCSTAVTADEPIQILIKLLNIEVFTIDALTLTHKDAFKPFKCD